MGELGLNYELCQAIYLSHLSYWYTRKIYYIHRTCLPLKTITKSIYLHFTTGVLPNMCNANVMVLTLCKHVTKSIRIIFQDHTEPYKYHCRTILRQEEHFEWLIHNIFHWIWIIMSCLRQSLFLPMRLCWSIFYLKSCRWLILTILTIVLFLFAMST